mgnify:CR=1 FL=1
MRDAARLATQASFGNTEALAAEIKTQGASKWISSQMSLASSRYTSGGNGTVHQNTLRRGDLEARFPGLLQVVLAQAAMPGVIETSE